jgi:MoaA/NifB/PqqE/SkfB family radical SAM enzyme
VLALLIQKYPRLKMFKFSELSHIHIEITNNCQARCPMCARNHHGGLPNPLLKLNDWTLEDFRNIITPEVLFQVKRIYFCGNFGDPMLNDEFIDMIRYTVSVNPNVGIGVHTNGGARKPSWWQDLALALPVDHMVHFGIDGLEDTHSLHRIGTTYENVIKNASAFIQSGGNAEWTFLEFKHNEHQVEECQRRAKELGFKNFVLKSSSRFVGEPKFDVFDKQGQTTHVIQPPTNTKLSYISKEVINNYKKIVAEAEIDCFVKGIKEIYIDAHMKLLPCCWLSSIPTTYYNDRFVDPSIDAEIKSQYNKLVTDLGGPDAIDARRGVKAVIESEGYQTVWNKYWNDEKLITCARVCGKFKNAAFAQPNDQFLENLSF